MNRGRRAKAIFDDEGFTEWVKEQFNGEKRHREEPESKFLATERKRIREVVSKSYGIGEGQLLKRRRGKENEGRNVAIYLTHQLRAERLTLICEEYGLKKESSASSVVEKVRKRIKTDRKFSKRVAEVERLLIKS